MTSSPTTFSTDLLIKTELPPLSGNVLEIREMLSDVNVSQKQVADTVSRDPVLAAKILRLANSAYYAGERMVASLTAAIAAIGNQAISETILISGLSDAFGRRILLSDTGKEIWLHLLGTAMAAGDMAHLAGLRGRDEAFSCGLLHDIGKLLFLRADGPLYTSVLERARSEGDLSAVEREAFGLDHAELGCAAAEAWRLPGPVCSMIRFHHEPARSTAGTALTGIVAIADNLEYMKTNDVPIDDLAGSELVSSYGFKRETIEALWEDVVTRMDSIATTV